MEHTDDVVNTVVVNGQPGEPAACVHSRRLLHGGSVRQGLQVHPGGENLGYLHVVELDGVADEIALVLVQASLGFGLVHHPHQLLLRDAVVVLVPQQHPQQLFPLGEQEVHRRQHHRQHPQQRRGGYGPGLRPLLGQALGRHLAEDQDHHGQHRGGHRGTLGAADELDKQHRANGGGHVVDDVVADEQGGEQPVVIGCQGQGPGGALVAVVGPGFQADTVQGCKSGLRGGEIGG